MAAQVLAAELASLIQDSKRKNPELRAAAEKSLADLKALPNTSEYQLAADLRKKPQFIKPFLLGCASKNQKLAASSIACLQRLANSNGLHHDTTREVLEGLRECTALSQDVQLRILQLLPSLLQNYGELVRDQLLVTAVHICFLLLASKNAVISNTAAATLQQVVVSVFDRVVEEDKDTSDEGLIQDVPTETGSVSVKQSALDAQRVLNDVCLLIDGQTPEFLVAVPFQPNFGLELIESILSNHAAVVVAHPELAHVLRTRLLPFVIRALSEKVSFPIALRSLRLLPVIFEHMLDALGTECEMVLSLINHMLDPDAGVLWKRVLCMELVRTLHADTDLIRQIYAHFDETAGKRNIVQDQMAVMVRLASEKPSVIGLGQHSSVPYSSGQVEDEADQMAALQAEGISGTIGVAMTVKSSTAHGISIKLSSMKVPCLEQLDKNEPPSIPPSYLYGLTLLCINSFSEGLAKYLLPFTVPNDGKSRRKTLAKEAERPTSSKGAEQDGAPAKVSLAEQDSEAILKIPVNPLELKSNPNYEQIATCSAMVDSCWPALLAAYSTFFHAALDSEFYRGLVRSFQKFTQVAGLLRLAVPRDAFLTTLSKNAMPSGPISLLNSHAAELVFSPSQENDGKDIGKSLDVPGTPERSRSPGDEPQASLNARNLLCLRALLNLGIALGPVLHEAWVIVLEALQQADFLIGHVTNQRRKLRTGGSSHEDSDVLVDVGNEIAAVGAAATRLFESTGDLTVESYEAALSALCGLLRDLNAESLKTAGAFVPETRRKPALTVGLTQIHDSRLNFFVIDQLTKIVRFNEQRFSIQPAAYNGWGVVSKSLRQVIAATHLDSEVRVRAGKALFLLASLTASPDVSVAIQDDTRVQGLVEIQAIVEIVGGSNESLRHAKPCEEEIHLLALETMRSMLELHGESLKKGWEHVFNIIASVFNEQSPKPPLYPPQAETTAGCKSLKLMRSSFASLQLVCSDFLSAVPPSCVTTLIFAVRCFTDQRDDFNMALTALPLHTNIADLVWSSEDDVQLHSYENWTSKTVKSLLETELAVDVSLQLLLSLVSISTDSRPEIRHGAIHSFFRALDNHANDFSQADWFVCVRVVLMAFFDHNEDTISRIIASDKSDDQERDSWDETATLLLENSSTLLNQHLTDLAESDGFSQVWSELLSHFNSMRTRESLSLSTSVFTALEKMLGGLADLPNSQGDWAALTESAWNVWLPGNPANHKERSRKTLDNQPALMAYLSCFIELHQVDHGRIDPPKLKSIVDQIYNCVKQSTPVSYAADLDALSPLQTEVVECMKALESSSSQSLKTITGGLSTLIVLPFDTSYKKPQQKGPTFVALSKGCMELLEAKLVKREDDLVSTDKEILKAALQALKRPISIKYAWAAEGKGVPMWRKATSVLVSILEATLPGLEAGAAPSQTAYNEVWNEILACCEGVLSTGVDDLENGQQASEELSFDIASFSDLYRLIVPALGSQRHTDELRRQFARMLYRYSSIHEAHPDDLPEADREPLAGLSSVHTGRTRDISASKRAQIGYRLLDALFDLVADHGDDGDFVRLAQAAAPYLILRTSLTIKAYVLDHPLRGRMPQPASQRKELFYVLRKLMELESQPKAIPDKPQVSRKNKKHLYWVYGLVTRALPIAQQDPPMHAVLTEIVTAVAQDLGI